MEQVRALFLAVLTYMEEQTRTTPDINYIEFNAPRGNTIQLRLMGRYLKYEGKVPAWTGRGRNRTWVRSHYWRAGRNIISFRWLDRRLELSDEEKIVYETLDDTVWRVPTNCVMELIDEFCCNTLTANFGSSKSYVAMSSLVSGFPAHTVQLTWKRPKVQAVQPDKAAAFKARLGHVKANQESAGHALRRLKYRTSDDRYLFVQKHETAFHHDRFIAAKLGCLEELEAAEKEGLKEFEEVVSAIDGQLEKLYTAHAARSAAFIRLITQRISEQSE
jgi:hypothetical protein